MCTRERSHLVLMGGGGVRDGREGGGHHIQKLPRTETPHPNAQSPSQACNIHRVARSPPPRTITLNIHTNAWEDVQGRTAAVRCGPFKVLWERVAGWPWLRAPAGLSAAEGDPPHHTGVRSGPLPPRRDHYGSGPYGDAEQGSAEPGEGPGTGPRALAAEPRR